jgi:hypothetical protein
MAHAAWTELQGVGREHEAALLRDDGSEAEKLRLRAHDVLDAHLDQHAVAAQAVRDLLGHSGRRSG